MRKYLAAVLMYAGGVVVWGPVVRAQDWTTGGYDAQRSSWVRSDAKISPDKLRKPGFQLLWKVNTGGVSSPVLLDLLIGHRGFRALGFVSGKADHVIALDTDLGRTEWERRLPSPPAGSPACAASLSPGLARATNAAVPAAAYGGGNAGQFARSAVGEPGEGAVTLVAAARRRDAAPRPAPVSTPAPSRERPSPHPFPVLYALASDGALRTLNAMDGSDADPPVPFLPPHADARGLIVVDDVAYVATSAGCGTAPAAVWALDLGSKQVATWRAPAGGGSGIAGALGPAIGPDGTIYVATTSGTVQALEPRTLAPKSAYRSGGPGFASSPVIFEQSGSTLIAAASRDGRIHLVDGARMASVTTPGGPTTGLAAGAAVSWADSSGTRWLLAAARSGVVAWKVIEQNGAPTLQAGWTSRDMPSPLTPMVINGVVFAVASGPPPAGPSVLYALDGATGRELWSSGTAIAGVARGGLSGESGQVYVGTSDGTLYAFGFPMEH